MIEIPKPGGSGSRKPPSDPPSGWHYARTPVTPTQALAQGSATTRRSALAGTPMDPVYSHCINATLD
jgi:hypothetical protein